MTAYIGTIDTILELNDGVSNNWIKSGNSGDSSSGLDIYYYSKEFPATTFTDVLEGSSSMVEDSGGDVSALSLGEYGIGDIDGIGKDTLYIRMSDDGNPDDPGADTISIEQSAHYNLLNYLKTVLEAAGGVTQRYDTSTDNHELIIMLDGYGGTEEIYIGFYCYQSVSSDYYNMAVATMKGYVEGNDFINQPGIYYSGVPCHNQAIGYWLSVNAARINGVLKVGTPIYAHFGAGNFLPFAPPNQWPQPLFCAGMLKDMAATRYSDTTMDMPWRATINRYNFAIMLNSGEWENSYNADLDKEIKTMRVLENAIRPAEDTYSVLALYIYDDTPNIYGEFDGIYNITGFDNVVENTTVIDGDTYVILQDVYRTGFDDYIAMKLV